MKVLLAPVNVAGQPILLAQELRRRGVDVSLLQYSSQGGGHPFGYAHDRVVDFSGRDAMDVQVEILKEVVSDGFDLVHFWMTTFFTSPRYRRMRGLDLPFLKVRDVRMIYRSTGFDLRQRSIQEERNPHNPYRHGYVPVFDDHVQRAHLDYLEQYIDLFIVQDPEMQEYMPQARVIPRGLDLAAWPHVGIREPRRPLVVHAPSNTVLKGTDTVLAAVEDLLRSGVRFDFKLIKGMSHSQAMRWYAKADVVIDQLLIGWYGVLTLEALAMGKPVICYVRDDLFEAFTPSIPIENANPDNIRDKLRLLITDVGHRQALACRARAFVEEVHDIRKVADAVHEAYRDVLGKQPRRPEGTADLDFFLGQFHGMTAQVGEQKRVIARLQRDLTAQLAATPAPPPGRAGPDHLAAEDSLFIAADRDEPEASTTTVRKDAAALRATARRRDVVAAEVAGLEARLADYQELLRRRRELRVAANRSERMLSADTDSVAAEDSLFIADAPARPEVRMNTGDPPPLVPDLAELRTSARRRDAVAGEVARLQDQVSDYDELIQRRRELRAMANRRQWIIEEIRELAERVSDYDERMAERRALRLRERAAGVARKAFSDED